MFRRSRVYLDAAAALPVKEEVLGAFAHAAKEFGNPSSAHDEGRRAKEILETARRDLARLLEAKADDVIFTSGATEANALAIRGLGRHLTHAFYLPSAHASIVENMRALEKHGVAIEVLPIRDGRVDIEKFRGLLRSDTGLVSMDAVCGETGTIWNTREVAHVLKGSHALLHVDASQAFLTEKATRAHFAADLLTLDAAKIGSVRGLGCLVASRTLGLEPLYAGGGQEQGLRPGTENPALAAACASALASVVHERASFRARAQVLRADFIGSIKDAFPDVLINEGRDVASHIVNISLLGRDTDYLVALLDAAGFAVSTRSACETDSAEGSRAVYALFGDSERAKSTLRVSWGPSITAREMSRFVRALVTEVRFIDNVSS
jgi:cysteine desulfurase